MRPYSKILSFLFLCAITLSCCEEESSAIDLTSIPYNPVSYEFTVPDGFPILEIPEDNPTTIDGVALGRHLFYDSLLSVDSTVACATCHLQASGFTDNLPMSVGVDGATGRRSSMSLVDAAFFTNGIFWDGRANSLEDQALEPVEDMVEQAHQWPDVIEDIRRHPTYPGMFRRAFGITSSEEITRDFAVKAISQFERTIMTTGTSKFDRVMANVDVFDTDEQQDGFDIYFDNVRDLPDGQCFHCHGGPLLTDHEYRNNGLFEAESVEDFPDLGRGGVTGQSNRNGFFRTPSLRNIAVTAPYMHDGRFETLEEVLDHYISGGFSSPNKDDLLDSIALNETHKAALLAFLLTLTDEELLEDSQFSNPN